MKAFMLIGVIILLQACSQTEQDVLNLNLQEYKSLALHIHPELEIEVFGEKQIIPGNIGISPEGMKAIHTHEPDRILHVESPYPHQFVIGDFFKIWGERFDSKCIFNLCEDEGHELLVFVNGEQSDLYESIPLHDKDKIKIVYRERK